MEKNIYHEKLADNIRVLRAKKKFTQTRLAILSGLSVETIGSIERQTTNPTIDVLIAIANALNVDLNTLLPLK